MDSISENRLEIFALSIGSLNLELGKIIYFCLSFKYLSPRHGLRGRAFAVYKSREL